MRDLVCGMDVDPADAKKIDHNGTSYEFCSDTCAQKFQQSPDRFLQGQGGQGMQGGQQGQRSGQQGQQGQRSGQQGQQHQGQGQQGQRPGQQGQQQQGQQGQRQQDRRTDQGGGRAVGS